MATNSTNSNAVNIRNLPVAQLATGTDYFILQTTNGTQTISFSDLNVVKTDINDNATVNGNISGGMLYLTGGAYIGGYGLSASNFWTTGSYGTGYGADLGANFIDNLIIQNGLILSAVPGTYINSYSNPGNPLYSSLYSQVTATSATLFNYTQNSLASNQASYTSALTSITANNLSTTSALLTAVTATNQTQYQSLTGIYNGLFQAVSGSKVVYDVTLPTSISTIPKNSLSAKLIYTNFFKPGYPTASLSIGQIGLASFIIMPYITSTGSPLSCFSYVVPGSIGTDSTSSYTLTAALAINSLQGVDYTSYVRLLVTS
jgi:hypothetical protein